MKPILDHAETYLSGLLPDRHPEFLAMEEIARKESFPIIGPICGQFCYQLTRTIAARRVFELGSGFGYSTAWFARGVAENGEGTVSHVVWDEGLSNRAREYITRMELQDMVEFHVCEAVACLENTSPGLDLVFLDIEKKDYPKALAVVSEKLRPGGLLLTHNVWWSGRVIDPENRTPETEAIRKFTETVMNPAQWISTLIPVDDGLMVSLRQKCP